MAKSALPTRTQVVAAYQAIRSFIRRTPVLELQGADFGLADCTLVLKLEMLQYAGSFKTRGAFANLVLREIPAAGVVAASGGNHGAAVAYAAMRRGVPARIFVPSVSSPKKQERIRRYGAQLVVGGALYGEALAASELWAADSGALRVHAFDQFETLLGQATLAMELSEQAPQLDTVLVAVGGGGLIGGIASWYGGDVKMIGVEPENAPTLTDALAAGHPVDTKPSPTGIAADSLAPVCIGALPFAAAQQFGVTTLLVSDHEIREAQEALWREAQVIAEPGGATAFAALLSRRYVPRPGERIGIVISGANTTAVNFQ